MSRLKPRSNSRSEYGHRLRVTRIVLGISEAEAATAHGVTLKTYRGYEDGNEPKNFDGILKFSDRFNVSLDWMGVGEPDHLASHLTKGASGKVAILPVITASRRALYEFWKQQSAGH